MDRPPLPPPGNCSTRHQDYVDWALGRSCYFEGEGRTASGQFWPPLSASQLNEAIASLNTRRPPGSIISWNKTWQIICAISPKQKVHMEIAEASSPLPNVVKRQATVGAWSTKGQPLTRATSTDWHFSQSVFWRRYSPKIISVCDAYCTAASRHQILKAIICPSSPQTSRARNNTLFSLLWT